MTGRGNFSRRTEPGPNTIATLTYSIHVPNPVFDLSASDIESPFIIVVKLSNPSEQALTLVVSGTPLWTQDSLLPNEQRPPPSPDGSIPEPEGAPEVPDAILYGHIEGMQNVVKPEDSVSFHRNIRVNRATFFPTPPFDHRQFYDYQTVTSQGSVEVKHILTREHMVRIGQLPKAGEKYQIVLDPYALGEWSRWFHGSLDKELKDKKLWHWEPEEKRKEMGEGWAFEATDHGGIGVIMGKSEEFLVVEYADHFRGRLDSTDLPRTGQKNEASIPLRLAETTASAG
ncbi:MAG: hypothetical protein M1814_002733 [Vezdaea aestivalis]|nr:MAG: hypothetical protein M1814_002733 [Vezdaea aestivalis]